MCARSFFSPTHAQSFDLVVTTAKLATAAKARNLRGIKLGCDGSKVRFLTVADVRFTEIRRLAPPGCNLSKFAKFAGVLEESKGIFPWDLFTSHTFLDLPRLPRLASEWQSRLHPESVITQAQVDEAQETFDSLGMRSVR